MKAIISTWRHSFSFFRPSQLKTISILAFRQFYRALRIFLKNAWWMIAFDAALFFACGPAIARTLTAYTKDTSITINPLLGLAMLASSVLTFLISSIFFILIRRRTVMAFKTYLRANLLKYIQLMLVFSLVFLFFICLILSLGIRTMPQMPLVLLIVTKVTQDLTAFFWLDRPYRLKNIFISFEKAINLLFYHMPFLILLVAMWLSIDYSLTMAAHYFFPGQAEKIMIDVTRLFIGTPKPTTLFIASVFGMKYVILLVKNIWISLLFAFYHKTKREVFSKSFF